MSLIKGGWLVNASASIFLQEVRNPNGAFNSQTGSSRFLFNYDPLDYVVLDATQGVTITGTSVPRTGADKLEGIIFPPSLTINAGSGGITLDQSISLYPSPEGGLSMTTTGGGNLTCNNEASIVISDSQSTQWTGSKNFTTTDPGNDVLHLNDPNPVLINISGSVSDLALYSPKSVEMYVTGNIIDSTVTAQNLRPSDTTIISAGGEILNHTPYVILTLPSGESPDFNALALVADQYLPGPNGVLVPNPNYNSTLQNAGDQFTYNPKTGGLEYEGQMSLAVENALLAMTTPFLDATTIETIYNQSQAESSTAGPGYNVAGPGTFRISAASINLGNGNGINSVGFENNPALVPYTARGANIDISTSGNLSMVASTIESSYGGEINVRSGGSIDVGSLLVPPASTQTTLGIISLWGGDINVIAADNINVDGSRIAAYDGGNIFVESLYGNVNAGSGGSGGALIHKYFVNKQGQVDLINDVIPGSGILATSFPQLVYGEASGHVGNITVDTPEGNIEASRGGIVQLALGPVVNNQASINLNAGSKNSDGTVAYVGNVDASGSGVVGGHVNISATGNINGLIVASLGANVTALQNISATVLSQGGATVSAGGTVSGTIVGVGSVSVSGASDVAAAFAGGGVSASGAQSGAAVASAPTGSSSASAAATTQQVTSQPRRIQTWRPTATTPITICKRKRKRRN